MELRRVNPLRRRCIWARGPKGSPLGAATKQSLSACFFNIDGRGISKHTLSLNADLVERD